jgi:hypothetical protein
MNIKKLLITATAAAVALAGTASAEILKGEVYQVTDGDVYVEMADTTVARVPTETALFYTDGEQTAWNRLRTGEDVVVNYEPIYGFQHYYYESADVNNPNKVTTYYLIQDVDLAETDSTEYEGRLYRPYPGKIYE